MTNKNQTKPKQAEDDSPLMEISSLETIYDRKKILAITSYLIEDIYSRISGDRFRTREGDRERLAYLRTLKELLALHAVILQDAKAPAGEGLPLPEDPELVAARKNEFDIMERAIYGLQSKGKTKVR